MRGSRLIPIVLAAGSSRRMDGQDKLLLEVEGEAMVRRVVRAMATGAGERVLVVVQPRAPDVVVALRGLAFDPVPNPRHAQGMGTSLAAAVAAAPADAAGFLVCVADLPYLTSESVSRVARTFLANPGAAIVPTHQGRRGHPVAIPAECREALLSLAGDVGARSVLGSRAAVELALADSGIVRDVDTVADYREVADGRPERRSRENGPHG